MEHADDTDEQAADVDPAELKRQIDDIRGAMGLEDRYPGQRRMWLVYGVGIGLSAVLTNLLFVIDLPNFAYLLLWFAMAGIIVLAQWRLVSGTSNERAPDGPDWRILVGSLVAGLLALWSSVADFVAENTAGALRGAHFFSHLVLFLGLGFLVAGAVLKAQRIRRRDRLPFYAGGAWMLVLAGILPHVQFLQRTVYFVFGTLFLAHSLIAYLLTGSD